MKTETCYRSVRRNLCTSCIWVLVAIFFMSCAAADPRKVKVELKETVPETKITSFSQALMDIGMMTEIYGVAVAVQVKAIEDKTGTSHYSGGEIPRDVTEITQSTLNAIGGNVTFIPYDPAYIQNQIQTGYSNFENVIIPDVVITGGITEFDRGIETSGSSTNFGMETKAIKGLPKGVPGNTVGIEYEKGEKYATSRITLDFNLINFETMSGIPRMQTVNTMTVGKAAKQKELGISLFGPTFGMSGSVKKVQGRHAAVRLLVELSMIQLIGKYCNLPYWTLFPDAKPDRVVLDNLRKEFYDMNDATRLYYTQQYLILHGHDVPISMNGELDDATRAALQDFDPTFDGKISRKLYTDLHLGVPITEDTYERRLALNGRILRIQEGLQAQVEPEQIEEPEPAVEQQQPQAGQYMIAKGFDPQIAQLEEECFSQSALTEPKTITDRDFSFVARQQQYFNMQTKYESFVKNKLMKINNYQRMIRGLPPIGPDNGPMQLYQFKRRDEPEEGALAEFVELNQNEFAQGANNRKLSSTKLADPEFTEYYWKKRAWNLYR